MNVNQMIEIKKEKGYSNAMISEMSGVPLGTVQKIFSGETSSPRYDTVQALSRALERVSAYSNIADNKMVSESVPAYNADFSRKKKKEIVADKTIEDYAALPEGVRVELIDGRFYDMAAPTLIHQTISHELGRLFGNHVKTNNGKCRVFEAPTDVQIDCDNKTMLQPDVFIVCKREQLTKLRVVGAPDLVVEVLSPSNIFVDLIFKYHKYKNAGVREYWVINPEEKDLVVFRFFESEEPHLYTFDDEVPVGIWNDECVIDFKKIYEDIEFMY